MMMTMACIFGDIWFVSAATVEIFYICMLFWILLRRSVYFLNICYIRVFYHFNRNRALHFPCATKHLLVILYICWTQLIQFLYLVMIYVFYVFQALGLSNLDYWTNLRLRDSQPKFKWSSYIWIRILSLLGILRSYLVDPTMTIKGIQRILITAKHLNQTILIYVIKQLLLLRKQFKPEKPHFF
jgi:hypothetical protein